jgi:hypothetical protein
LGISSPERLRLVELLVLRLELLNLLRVLFLSFLVVDLLDLRVPGGLLLFILDLLRSEPPHSISTHSGSFVNQSI